MKYVLGIDLGTSGTKTVLFQQDGVGVCSATVEYPMSQPQNGWAEQDPKDWWNAAVSTVKTVLQKSGVDPKDVVSLGISGQMHGLVMLDENGEVLRPSIIWCDQRTQVECDEITEKVGYDNLIRITANPALTGFTLSKIMWVRKHQPEIYAKCRHILLPKDYVRYKLTGLIKQEISDASGTNLLDVKARCKAGQTETLVFGNYSADEPDETITEDVEAFAYNYAVARVDELDTYDLDNTFYLYGGAKQVLKIQYCSKMPNNYFATAMDVIRDRFGSKWDVEYTEILPGQEYATEGFDVYIFEHETPKTFPQDGLVILSNPDKVPSNIGLRLGQRFNAREDNTLTQGEEHPIMKGIRAENIIVTKFTEITSYDGYVPLMYSFGKPVVMAKNEPDQKILVMTFSLNFSDFSMLLEFPLFLSNALNYYIPATMTEYVFNVNESVKLNSRSEKLSVVGPMTNIEMTKFPGTVDLKKPGVYTVTQVPISGNKVVENFYVRIPAAESNTAAVEDVLTNPYFYEANENEDLDLLFYFAMALVILLFMEWWLQSRKQF